MSALKNPNNPYSHHSQHQYPIIRPRSKLLKLVVRREEVTHLIAKKKHLPQKIQELAMLLRK
jgi:hypothetical protein